MNSEWKAELAKTLREVFAGVEELPLTIPTANSPAQSYRDNADSLESFEASIRFCTNCELHVGREKLVFGSGHAKPKVLFIGDMPSRADDNAGKPFSDQSGELLNKMIAAMNLKKEEVYLTNLLKCKPPTEHVVSEAEALMCQKHLEKQINMLNPEVLVALGEITAQTLVRSDIPLERLRAQPQEFRGRKLFVTHHPRELLSHPEKKKDAWNDLQKVMQVIGLKK